MRDCSADSLTTTLQCTQTPLCAISGPAHNLRMATREELQQLVSSLPEEALAHAKAALERWQTWPPAPPPVVALGREAALARMQERMKERMTRVGLGGRGGVGLFTGGGSVRSDGKAYGRRSFGYEDEEGKVYETTIVEGDRELTLTERLWLDEDAGTMKMKIVFLGPDQTTATFEHIFKLPPPETSVQH